METGFVDLQKIIAELEIKPGEVVADFGAGSGFLTLEAARKTGASGTIYALDILEEPLEMIQKKAADLRLSQIKTVKVNLEKPSGSGLPADSCDWVFLSNVLFQNETPENLILEAVRILKPQGRILVVDWHPEKMLNPETHHPLSASQTKEIFKRLGMSADKAFSASASHYGLIFTQTNGLKKLFSFIS